MGYISVEQMTRNCWMIFVLATICYYVLHEIFIYISTRSPLIFSTCMQTNYTELYQLIPYTLVYAAWLVVLSNWVLIVVIVDIPNTLVSVFPSYLIKQDDVYFSAHCLYMVWLYSWASCVHEHKESYGAWLMIFPFNKMLFVGQFDTPGLV